MVADVRASRYLDQDDAAFLLDRSNTGTSLNIAGSIEMAAGESINADNGTLTLGGANLDLQLGDSTADEVFVPANGFFMRVGEGDSAVNFFDQGAASASALRWDDVTTFFCGGNIGSINFAFRWEIADNFSSGWVLGQPTDVELALDDIGAMQIDSTLQQSGACDLAEAFLGPDGLDAGAVVVLDAGSPEGVVASSRAYQGGIVGAVSTHPGILTGGPTADVYPLVAEMRQIRYAGLEHPHAAATPNPLPRGMARARE